MGAREEQIVCRRCGEEFPTADENCPHCGTPVRGYRGPIALIVLGLVIAIPTSPLIGFKAPFFLLGIAMMVVGAYVIYDKRQRINEATQYE